MHHKGGIARPSLPAYPSEVYFQRREHLQFPWVFVPKSSLLPKELPTSSSLHLIMLDLTPQVAKSMNLGQ